MKFNFIKFHKINILTVLFTAFFLVPVFSFAQTGPTELYLETDLNIVIDGVPLVYPPYGTVFIDSISPSSNLKAGDLITITGTGFETANNAIYFTPASGGPTITVPNVSTIDTTKISLPIPSNIINGSYLVSVDTPNGGLSNNYNVVIGSNIPSILSITLDPSTDLFTMVVSPGFVTTEGNMVNVTNATNPNATKISPVQATLINGTSATNAVLTFQSPFSIKDTGIFDVTLINNHGETTYNWPAITIESNPPSVVMGQDGQKQLSCPTNSNLVGQSCVTVANGGPQLINRIPSSGGACPDGYVLDGTDCVLDPSGPIAQADNAGLGTTITTGILDPIVPCDGVKAIGNTDPNFRECDFNMLMTLARNIINFLLVFSTAIAAACFFFAGYLYLTAGGNVGQVTRAHSIFKNVAVGLIIALSAWLIVYTVLTTLIPDDQQLKNYNLLNNA